MPLDAFKQAQGGIIARAGPDGRVKPGHRFQIMVINVRSRRNDRFHRCVRLVPEIGSQDFDRGLRRHVAQRLDHLYELRSEEHTSELQSLMRISYAVFCLKKKKSLTATNNSFTTPLTVMIIDLTKIY